MIEIVELHIDAGHTRKAMNTLEKRNYPFALASTLTKVAKAGQKAVQQRTKRIYKLYSRYTLRNIRITPAKKSDVVMKRMAYSEVRTDKRISHYMPQHETSATKRSTVSKNLAIPAKGLKNKRYRTAKGVKFMYRPDVLMNRAQQARKAKQAGSQIGPRTKSGKASQKNVFFIKSRTGASVMVRRLGLKRKPLQTLWVMKKSAKIKKTWNFERTVYKRVRRIFNPTFNKAMRTAIATAR